MAITDRGMQSKPVGSDIWLKQPFGRGKGTLEGRITPSGERRFYFRYNGTRGQIRLLIGEYHAKGDAAQTFSLAQALNQASEWSMLYQTHQDLREHFAEQQAIVLRRQADEQEATERLAATVAEAQRQASLNQATRLTVRLLFKRWQETDLRPLVLKNGERQGRKDGGALVEHQFTKHLFPEIGDKAAQEVRRADVMAVLDKIKAKGLSRTANMVLSSLRQMFTFAIVREIVTIDPTQGINKKRDGGGKDVERDRFLSAEEIKSLAELLPTAKLNKRTESAIWLLLSTGCRIGELMGAAWSNAGKTVEEMTAAADSVNAKVGVVDLSAKTWLIFDTKNKQDHLIHLSPFAITQFEALAALREVGHDGKPTPWVFPNSKGIAPVCTKTVNKQLQDRQRAADQRMSNRAKGTEALLLPGGPWTPHDLRRTAATLMSKAGVNTPVIHLCLNHKPQDKLDRIYIQDDHMDERQQAFTVLGKRLQDIVAAASDPGAVHVTS